MSGGLWRDAQHHYFVDAILGGEYAVQVGPLVSVTTALKALDKSGPLVGWATRETAAAAIRNLDALQAMVHESGPEAAQKWLQTKPGYIKDTAADSGSRVHLLAEAIANGQEISEDDKQNPKVRQYLRFVAEWQPRFVGVEMMVVNFTEAYAGTGDIWAWLPTGSQPPSFANELWLLDIKTGKGTYPDMALQLAALHNAEWTGAPDRDELEPSPKATRFGILHLQDDGYELLEYQVTPEDYQTFLSIKNAHTWLEDRAKSVVLGPVKREVAA
jgi:hypothetical protein